MKIMDIKKRAAAFVLAAVTAVSVAGCGNKETQETEDITAETTKTAATTAKPSDSKKDSDTTTKKTKKKKTTDSSSESSDSKKETKKTKKTTKKTETSIDVTVPDPDDSQEGSLGWTKEIYEKYRAAKDDEDFLKSLTYDEFAIVVKLSDAETKEAYNMIHGISDGQQTQTRPPETSTMTVSEANIDPGIKIDKTVDAELRNVYANFNVDINDLCAITGLTEDEFFYYWNNVKDQQFRNDVSRMLFGYNYYDASNEEHPLVPDTISMKIVTANWDKSGNLHVVCSMKNGYPGLAYNVVLGDLEVVNKNGVVIARIKDYGALTPHVDDTADDAEFVGLYYNTPVNNDFVFDNSHVLKHYANIRNEIGLTMKFEFNCGVYNP